MNDLAARVLTVPEAAELMRVSERTYYAAAARGEVPAVRIGRRLVVPGAALERLLEGGLLEAEKAREGISTLRDKAGLDGAA
jgi:excisionase family DNA binding protein